MLGVWLMLQYNICLSKNKCYNIALLRPRFMHHKDMHYAHATW